VKVGAAFVVLWPVRFVTLCLGVLLKACGCALVLGSRWLDRLDDRLAAWSGSKLKAPAVAAPPSHAGPIDRIEQLTALSHRRVDVKIPAYHTCPCAHCAAKRELARKEAN
jgi:hypothetical protein